LSWLQDLLEDACKNADGSGVSIVSDNYGIPRGQSTKRTLNKLIPTLSLRGEKCVAEESIERPLIASLQSHNFTEQPVAFNSIK
jgi:hypothetical protein